MGATISNGMKDINVRLTKAWAAFGWLKQVWNMTKRNAKEILRC